MISQKQKKILAFPYSDYDAIICDGAVRSGKTSIMTVAFIDWAMREFSGQRFGICGKTVDSATKNIIIPYISMSYAKQRYTIRWRRSDKLLEIRRGRLVNYFEVFGGKDEGSAALIQGRTLAGALLDEVVLMPESFVNQAVARCSVEGAKIWFSCNPGNPNHWFKAEWINRKDELNALYLHFTMNDNPSLGDKTIKRYKTMFSGVFYQRYVLGEWVAAEGLVYPMFDNVVKVENRAYTEYVVSMDYGIMNPTAMILWGHADDGVWYAVREYYHSGRETNEQKTDQQYYDDMCEMLGDIMPRYIIVDPSATSFITLVKQRKKYHIRQADNVVLEGIQHTATALVQGQIMFNKCCKHTIEEFGLYSWDDGSVEDAVIKENDHCLTGDTVVNTIFGGRKIKDLVGKFGLVWSYNEKRKKRCIRPFWGARKTRENQPIMKITLENGKVVRCTPDHKILTENGWIEAERLTKSSKVVDIMPTVHLFDVAKIEIEPNEDVYNMEVMGTHNFSANGGIIVHNCMDAVRYFVQTMRLFRPKMEYQPIMGGALYRS